MMKVVRVDGAVEKVSSADDAISSLDRGVANLGLGLQTVQSLRMLRVGKAHAALLQNIPWARCLPDFWEASE